MAQYVSNRCKDLFKRKIHFGVRCTLTEVVCYMYNPSNVLEQQCKYSVISE